jgi:hypothetical protein
MDVKALQNTFNYSDTGSIYEMKKTLKRKLKLVETRLREAELKNSTYNRMLNQMQKTHF